MVSQAGLHTTTDHSRFSTTHSGLKSYEITNAYDKVNSILAHNFKYWPKTFGQTFGKIVIFVINQNSHENSKLSATQN